MPWQPFPLPDGSYSDPTRAWSEQDVLCYLPTPAEAQGTRSRTKYPPVPGLQVFANVGDGPHRGARDVEGKLFVVSGRTLYQVATDGMATAKGTIPGTGRVTMTHNQVSGGNQLVIGTVDNAYVYDTTDGTLEAQGVPLQSVDFLGQLVLGIEPQRRFWRYSGLADAKSWNTLDNESAESSPDRIVGGIVSQGEWLVAGERTIEVFPLTGGSSSAFQRGAVIERGCANAATLCRLDNSVFFVDNNRIPCRLQGYTPVPIAPKAIIDALSRCDPRKMFAFTWEDRGYVVYYITCQDGQTFGYDVTSQRWHRRASFGLDRWRLNTLFKWNGDWYGGDYVNGKLYKLSWDYMYEGCEIMPRRLRTGVLHANGNRVTVHGLRLTVAAGGEESAACQSVIQGLAVAGNLSDGAVGDTGTYQYTSAGGALPHTFSIVSGSLPPGATMDAAGLVTYDYTAGGTYSWTVQVTDAVGATAIKNDTAAISAGYWWATTDNVSHLADVWQSSDLSAWTGPVARTPNVATSDYGPVSLGVNVALVGGTQSTLERITDFDPAGGYATSTVTLGAGIDRIRRFGDYAVAMVGTTASPSNTYYTTANKGATWTARTAPGTGRLIDVQRLDSGRWIALLSDGPSTRFLYSDDAGEPVNWTNATGGVPSTGGAIACNGTAAAYLGTTDVCRTTDGAVWTNLGVDTTGFSHGRDACALGDVMLLAAEGASSSGYIRSTDAGLTWGALVATVSVIQRFDVGGDVIVATFPTVPSAGTSGGIYSTNQGASFSDVPIPYATSGTDKVRYGYVRYVP